MLNIKGLAITQTRNSVVRILVLRVMDQKRVSLIIGNTETGVGKQGKQWFAQSAELIYAYYSNIFYGEKDKQNELIH